MLIVNYVIDTLPMKRQKNLKNFDDLSQLRTTTKRTEEEKKKLFKTKVLVPNKHVRRWRHRSGFSPTFSQRAVSTVVLRAGRAAFYNELPHSGKES